MQKAVLSIITFSIISLTATPVFALTVSVSAKQELILTSKKCEELIHERNQLCEWKKSLQPEFVIPKYINNTCLPAGKGSVKLHISECLPDFTKTYQNIKLVHDGPNCWGTAMSFKKLSITPRFMWPEEIQYWMESPLCRKLSPNEKLLPGDIINVYAPEKLDESELNARDAGSLFWDTLYPERYMKPEVAGYTGYHRLLHSVTFITPNIAFGKDSPSNLDKFYFHEMEQVYGRPRNEERECQENQVMTPHIREYHKTPQKIRGSKCSYFSQAFRCENFNEYFAKDIATENAKEIFKRVQALQEIQKTLFPQLVSVKKLFTQTEINSMISTADKSLDKATSGLKENKLDKTRERLFVMEYFSAAGIRQTLEQFNFVKPIK